MSQIESTKPLSLNPGERLDANFTIQEHPPTINDGIKSLRDRIATDPKIEKCNMQYPSIKPVEAMIDTGKGLVSIIDYDPNTYYEGRITKPDSSYKPNKNLYREVNFEYQNPELLAVIPTGIVYIVMLGLLAYEISKYTN